MPVPTVFGCCPQQYCGSAGCTLQAAKPLAHGARLRWGTWKHKAFPSCNPKSTPSSSWQRCGCAEQCSCFQASQLTSGTGTRSSSSGEQPPTGSSMCCATGSPSTRRCSGGPGQWCPRGTGQLRGSGCALWGPSVLAQVWQWAQPGSSWEDSLDLFSFIKQMSGHGEMGSAADAAGHHGTGLREVHRWGLVLGKSQQDEIRVKGRGVPWCPPSS